MALMKIRDELDIENLQTTNPKIVSRLRKVQDNRLAINIGSLSKQLSRSLTRLSEESSKVRIKVDQLKFEKRRSNSFLSEEERKYFASEEKKKLLQGRPKTAMAKIYGERRRHSMPADVGQGNALSDLIKFRHSRMNQVRRGSLPVEGTLVRLPFLSCKHSCEESTTLDLDRSDTDENLLLLAKTGRRNSMPTLLESKSVLNSVPATRRRCSVGLLSAQTVKVSGEKDISVLQRYRNYIKLRPETAHSSLLKNHTQLAINNDGMLDLASRVTMEMKHKHDNITTVKNDKSVANEHVICWMRSDDKESVEGEESNCIAENTGS